MARQTNAEKGRPGVLGLAQGLAFGALMGLGLTAIALGTAGLIPTPRGIAAGAAPGGGGTTAVPLSVALGATVAVLTAPIGWRQARARADARTALAVLVFALALVAVIRDVGTWALVALPGTVSAVALLLVRWRQREEPMLHTDRSPTPHLAASLFLAAVWALLIAVPAAGLPVPGLEFLF